ncbi:MAG TPA: hypothetical protein VHL53_23860 [Acidimicrobiia bacterium]|nr:hypothetical protein [Acidimicrobiia bacterium]
MRRRLLAAAGAAAIGLAIVMPVAARAVPADPTHTMEFYTPVRWDTGSPVNQPATAPDKASVSSTDQVVTVKVNFKTSGANGGGVKSWDVRIVPVNGGPGSSCHEDLAPENGLYKDIIYINCPWDTTRATDRTLDQPTPSGNATDQLFSRNWHLKDNGPSVNGPYNIQVTARSAGQVCNLLSCPPNAAKEAQYELYEDPGAQRWRQVYVTNGVADPTGVSSSFDPASNRINITWAANPEPDTSYSLREKIGDGAWSPGVAVPQGTTNYVKTVDSPGKYQYQVQAVRPAPTDKDGSATKTSRYVAASAVTVAQVAPPTTAGNVNGPNGPDGTIDHSGDNGPLIPTDPTSPTAPGTHVAGAVTTAGSRGGTVSGAKNSGGKATGSHGAAAGDSEAEGEGPDDGYAATLNYNQEQDGTEDGLGAGDEESPESMSKLVNVPKPQDARALLVPLAVSLAVFVLSMQMIVVIRRRPAMATVEDDFDDWMGF